MNPGIVHGRRPGEHPTYSQELAELLRIIVVAGVPVGIVHRRPPSRPTAPDPGDTAVSPPTSIRSDPDPGFWSNPLNDATRRTSQGSTRPARLVDVSLCGPSRPQCPLGPPATLCDGPWRSTRPASSGSPRPSGRARRYRPSGPPFLKPPPANQSVNSSCGWTSMANGHICSARDSRCAIRRRRGRSRPVSSPGTSESTVSRPTGAASVPGTGPAA